MSFKDAWTFLKGKNRRIGKKGVGGNRNFSPFTYNPFHPSIHSSKLPKKSKKKWQYFSHPQHPEKEGPFQGSTLAYAYAKLRADPQIGKQFAGMKKGKQKEVAETLANHLEENQEKFGLTPLSPEQVSEFKDTKKQKGRERAQKRFEERVNRGNLEAEKDNWREKFASGTDRPPQQPAPVQSNITMKDLEEAKRLIEGMGLEPNYDNMKRFLEFKQNLATQPVLPKKDLEQDTYFGGPREEKFRTTFRGEPITLEELRQRVGSGATGPKIQADFNKPLPSQLTQNFDLKDLQDRTALENQLNQAMREEITETPKEKYQREKEERYLATPSIDDAMANPITPKSKFQEEKEARQTEMSTEDRMRQMQQAREAHETVKTLGERKVNEATTMDDFMNLLNNPTPAMQVEDEFNPAKSQQYLHTFLDEDGNLRPEFR